MKNTELNIIKATDQWFNGVCDNCSKQFCVCVVKDVCQNFNQKKEPKKPPIKYEKEGYLGKR